MRCVVERMGIGRGFAWRVGGVEEGWSVIGMVHCTGTFWEIYSSDFEEFLRSSLGKGSFRSPNHHEDQFSPIDSGMVQSISSKCGESLLLGIEDR